MNDSSGLLALIALLIPLDLLRTASALRSADALDQAVQATYRAACVAISVAIATLCAPSTPAHLAPAFATVVRFVRLDGVSCLLLPLVTGLGVVVARFSRSYLRTERGKRRYAASLLCTLAAVGTLVVASHLLVIWIAWIATSFALHALLTFYGDRPKAIVAAHTKFILSRSADVCVGVALWLIHDEIGSLALVDLEAWAASHSVLPLGLEAACSLVVVAVALRSAQVPFHGWLVQVMEAPTPVSALLHAGVVNVGALVLFRIAPLLAHSDVASCLLVLFGICTAVLASLVMSTRSSVKVTLAWSTCAQLGFMLVECGLGLWSFALVHLLAHSLYKAHAFLSAGGAAASWRARPSMSLGDGASLAGKLAAVLVLCASVVMVTYLIEPSASLRTWAEALVLGLAVAPFAARTADRGARVLVRQVPAIAGFAALTGSLHAAFDRIGGFPPPGSGWLPWTLAALGLVALGSLQLQIEARPASRAAHALRSMLIGARSFDSYFVRTTFRFWPPTLPTEVQMETER